MFGMKKRLGFGCMRLKMDGDKVDYAEFSRMVDAFLANGYNYFDTAHGYINRQSEPALKACLTSRYPREAYLLADKLSMSFFNSREDIRPFFQEQLETCGVDYFDFYLMHALSKEYYVKFKACKAYETLLELKAEGKIRHIGMSFHDTAEVLEQILTECPLLEFVQLQFNYIDYDDPLIQSRKCYEVCRKLGKPVIIMEPVKGGNLVKLPAEAEAVFAGLDGGSNASYAIRFAAGFEGVEMVLSGMGSMEMLNENMSTMNEFRPLDRGEQEAVMRVREIFGRQKLIPCTNCHYCTDGCPVKINIPEIFACKNTLDTFHDMYAASYYYDTNTAERGKASDCIGCGKCEAICPQHLKIRELLADVARTFEKKA